MDLPAVLSRIEQKLKEIEISATAASKKAGLSGDAIRNMRRRVEAGGDAGVSTTTLAALAPVLQTSVSWLLEGKEGSEDEDSGDVRLSTAQVAPVAKVGTVAAGVFREVDDTDQTETVWINEPVDPVYPNARRFAMDVEGDSVNDLKPRPILPGDTVICVAFEDIANQVKIRDGMVVVVERTRDGGHTREFSIKQIEFYEDRIEFHPRSTNPKHKPIVVKRDYEADEGTRVEIIGLVRRVSNEFPAY